MRASAIFGVLSVLWSAGCAVSSQTALRDLRPVLRTHLDGKPRAAQLEVLAKALIDISPSARLAAARILGREYILGQEELRPLTRALDSEKDPVVRAEVARALLLQLPLSFGPVQPAAGGAALPPSKGALPPGDPFRRLGTLNRENMRYLREIAAGSGMGPSRPGATPGMHPLRMLEQTTLGPGVPMPIGSQGLPK